MENRNYNANEDRALDWDELVDQGQEFTVLPAGVYPFRVETWARARHATSEKLPACPQAILTIVIDGGQNGTRKIEHNLFLHTKTQGFLNQFFTAIGCPEENGKVRMDWNRVTGATGRCEIYVDKYQKRDGSQGESNKIKKFLKPAQGIAATAPTAPQQTLPFDLPAPQAPQGYTPGAF